MEVEILSGEARLRLDNYGEQQSFKPYRKYSNSQNLARVEFDNQLLFNAGIDLIARWRGDYLAY